MVVATSPPCRFYNKMNHENTLLESVGHKKAPVCISSVRLSDQQFSLVQSFNCFQQLFHQSVYGSIFCKKPFLFILERCLLSKLTTWEVVLSMYGLRKINNLYAVFKIDKGKQPSEKQNKTYVSRCRFSFEVQQQKQIILQFNLFSPSVTL